MIRSSPPSSAKPLQAYDARLIENVAPREWTNPVPAERYNLVVIGAGTAGLVTAAAAAGLGAKVALIERFRMGGDCLNYGCVPSKAILRSGRFYTDLETAPRFSGAPPIDADADFDAAMARMRRLRAQLSRTDSAARFRDLGVDVFFGEAHFADRTSVTVGGARLVFRKAVIATGSRAAHPDIDGIAAAGYHTNETVFDLATRPRRLLVIGGGPLGCELAQGFARLGCRVTIVNRERYFLPDEERDAAEILADALRLDGIEVRHNTLVTRVSNDADGKHVEMTNDGAHSTISVDEILVGAGRVPNVAGLGLDTAGVRYDEKIGVHVNDFLQTSNANIYAAGDVAMDRKYTHVADATARIAVQNALFLGRQRVSALVVPWCTYTDPEIAHVGMYTQDANASGFPMRTFTIPMSAVDRAVLDGEEAGFVKLHVREGSDRILGATIVARHAGEMINEISLAMVADVGLKTVAKVLHSYPTQADAIRKAADAYTRTRLRPWMAALGRRWLAWRRS